MTAEFRVRLNRRDISNSEVLDDLRRVAAELQIKSVTKVQYDVRGVFGATTVLRKLGSWNTALKAADLEVSNRQDISNDELFENIANIWTKLGRQPFGREVNDKARGSIFSLATYEKRFKSWNKSLLAFSNYINSGKNDVYDDGKIKNLPDTQFQRRRTSREINWRLRAKVLIKHSCICQMCGDSPAKNPETVLHADHILAWANGGETLEENLQTLCEICNIGKI